MFINPKKCKGQIIQVKLCFYDDVPYDRIAYVEYSSGRVFHYPHQSFLDLPKTVIDFLKSDRSVIISQYNCRIKVSEGLLHYVVIYRMRGCLSHV